jgi:hypothetical protein
MSQKTLARLRGRLKPLAIKRMPLARFGKPLELAKAHWALGGASISALALPATLHASLLARLDRLGSARETAQIGAVLGRGFSYALLQSVAGLDDGSNPSARQSGLQFEDLGVVWRDDQDVGEDQWGSVSLPVDPSRVRGQDVGHLLRPKRP